jgi:hypothetical protein
LVFGKKVGLFFGIDFGRVGNIAEPRAKMPLIHILIRETKPAPKSSN